jgi:hypothetical protein
MKKKLIKKKIKGVIKSQRKEMQRLEKKIKSKGSTLNEITEDLESICRVESEMDMLYFVLEMFDCVNSQRFSAYD